MAQTRPYGNPAGARAFLIGHDPTLQASEAKAEHVFFLDLLESSIPSDSRQRAKYDFARSVVEYAMLLTGWHLSIDEIYFTNLCNQFLKREKKGYTVLIPDEVADSGIRDIETAMANSPVKVVLAMSLQVFYHMVRTNFVDNNSPTMRTFLEKAKPNEKYAKKNAYRESRKSPFVDVCGNVFYHAGVPVIPVLHVKSWSRVTPRSPYFELTNRAINATSAFLKS